MSHFDFKCAKPEHHSSPILFVCLEPKCKSKRRSCIHCAQQNHIKHDLVSIQKFISEINFNLQKYNNHPEKHEIFKLVNTIRTDFSKSFITIKAWMIQLLEKVESKVNDFLNTIQEVLTTNQECIIKSHILNTLHQTQTALQDYLAQSIKASKIQLGAFKDVKRKLYDYFYSFEQGSDHFRCELQKASNNLQKITATNFLVPRKETQNLMFSEINKTLCIQLEDSKKIIQHLSAPYNHTVCCLEKPFDFANNSFCVRIGKNPNKKIWIGVCALSIVRKNNFFNCFGTGKGTYALDQTGSSGLFDGVNNFAAVSSHHELKASVPGGSPYLSKWNFKEGDVIYVKVDVLGKFLCFYLLNQQYDAQGVHPASQIYSQYYAIEMKFPNTSDIYGFVGLNGIGGDSAQILSRSEVDKITAVYGNKWLFFTGELVQEDEDEQDEFW